MRRVSVQTEPPIQATPARQGATRQVYVVQTYAIGRRRGGISHYEVQLAPLPDPEAPRIRLVTSDLAIYRLALAAEDTGRCFDAGWVMNGSRFVLDALDERK